MIKICSYEKLPELFFSGKSVAIGNFDGVHIGHQQLIKKADGVLTFFPHPLKILNPEKAPLMLFPLDEKLRLIKLYGAERVLVIEFTSDFSRLSPEEFFYNLLVDKLGVSAVVVGENFRFGRNRMGDTDYLKEMGKRFGVNVEIVPSVMVDGLPVSSTRLRRVIREGRIDLARRLLARPYKLIGKVVRGDGRGRMIGFPTANIEVENELLPKNGVYAVCVEIDGVLYKGVMNIGFNPTFSGRYKRVEIHIMGFDGNLYGKRLGAFVIERLRDEKKFDNIKELKEAITKDIVIAEEILCWERLFS